jgi:hypothetical protein
MKKIPSLKSQVPKFKDNPEDMETLCRIVSLTQPTHNYTYLLLQMNAKISSTRSDDVGSLKYKAMDYVLLDLREQLNPPISNGLPKTGIRGLNHPELGRLLCPAKDQDDFNNNPTKSALPFAILIVR